MTHWRCVEHTYHSIPGWFDFADLYDDLVTRTPDGGRIVEVGVWLGKSTSYLATAIANSGKAIRLDVVDHFQGSPEIDVVVRVEDQRAEFDRHTQPVKHLIRDVHAMKSWEAARLYADGSLDAVFIDAAHDAPSVLRDLQAWWPKVKVGGILAGHDFDWDGVQQAIKPWAESQGVEVGKASRRCWWVERKAPALAGLSLTMPEGQRKALVAVCSNERSVYRQTVKSLMALGWGQRVTDAMKAHGFADVQFFWSDKHVLVSDLRNDVADVALGTGCSHVLFLDADMTWPADVLTRMLAHHDNGIVSGVYHLKVWPHWPVALKNPVVNPQTWNVDYTYVPVEGRSLVPVDLVGMGCVLIPTAVFAAMPRPWFEYQTKADGSYDVTEDVAFCQKALATGVPIAVDPTIQCGHVGQQVITAPWHDRSLMEMAMLEQAGAAKVVA